MHCSDNCTCSAFRYVPVVHSNKTHDFTGIQDSIQANKTKFSEAKYNRPAVEDTSRNKNEVWFSKLTENKNVMIGIGCILGLVAIGGIACYSYRRGQKNANNSRKEFEQLKKNEKKLQIIGKGIKIKPKKEDSDSEMDIDIIN